MCIRDRSNDYTVQILLGFNLLKPRVQNIGLLISNRVSLLLIGKVNYAV